MAEGDIQIHNIARLKNAQADLDFVNDDIRIMLLNGWTPNIDTDDYWDDISANEIGLTGYTANGQSLTNKSVSRNDTSNKAEADCDNPLWANLATGTITRGAIVKWTGTASTSYIIGNIEIATNPDGRDYELVVNAAGLLNL